MGNPIYRKRAYRYILLATLTQLESIDGQSVTEQDIEKSKVKID